MSMASPTTLCFNGGAQLVYSGGVGYEADVYSGGFQRVFSDWAADYTFVSSGGYQYNFGSSYGANVYGVAYTYAGGVNSSTDVGSGGAQYIYGSSYEATIASGGTQYVSSGGEAILTTDEGSQYVYSGGISHFVSALTADGDQFVDSGGGAYYTHLSGGGREVVNSDGLGYDRRALGQLPGNPGRRRCGLRLNIRRRRSIQLWKHLRAV